MTGPQSIVVAGAGALGLACALSLADAGARVTVLDPAPPGDNASGVAAGMLAPVLEAALDPLMRPHFDLMLAARDLWPTLVRRAGIDLVRDGAVVVGDELWLQATAAAFADIGAAVRPMTGEALRLAAPGLDRRFARGLWTGDDWRIAPRPALAALRRAAVEAGVAFREDEASGAERCDLLVVATGAASGLAPELSAISPIKGHILRLPGELRAVVRSREVYAAPGEGGMLVGATMETGLSDRTVDPAQAARLLAAARTLFPGLGRTGVRAEVGVRGATPDGLPLVGPSRASGVLIAAGARRNGWLLAPLVAQVVTAYASGRDPGPYAGRFDPLRFSRSG
jgi:glycine oxidase